MDDQKVVFQAQTRGNKYKIVAYQDQKDLSYSAAFFTNEREDGHVGSCSLQQMKDRLKSTIIQAKIIDRINYRISLDNIGI